jgi:hypothetical protein
MCLALQKNTHLFGILPDIEGSFQDCAETHTRFFIVFALMSLPAYAVPCTLGDRPVEKLQPTEVERAQVQRNI